MVLVPEPVRQVVPRAVLGSVDNDQSVSLSVDYRSEESLLDLQTRAEILDRVIMARETVISLEFLHIMQAEPSIILDLPWVKAASQMAYHNHEMIIGKLSRPVNPSVPIKPDAALGKFYVVQFPTCSLESYMPKLGSSELLPLWRSWRSNRPFFKPQLIISDAQALDLAKESADQ